MRIKALILSLILLFSAVIVTGCSKDAKNEENTQEESTAETAQLQEDDAEQAVETNEGEADSSDTAEEQKLKSKPYVDMMTNGRFFMHYTSSETLGDETVEAEYKMAYDDKKLYMSIESADFAITTISDESTMYLLDDASKTYTVMNVSEDDIGVAEDEELITGEEYVFVGSGESKMGGRSLYYEEYSTGVDSLVRYYFYGDKLYAIEGMTGEESSIMYIIEMTDDVDPELFSVPDDYSELTY